MWRCTRRAEHQRQRRRPQLPLLLLLHQRLLQPQLLRLHRPRGRRRRRGLCRRRGFAPLRRRDRKP